MAALNLVYSLLNGVKVALNRSIIELALKAFYGYCDQVQDGKIYPPVTLLPVPVGGV